MKGEALGVPSHIAMATWVAMILGVNKMSTYSKWPWF